MIHEKMLDALRENVRSHMSESRYRHTLGVEREMRQLAALLCPERVCEAAAAGLLHDVTKCLSTDEQLAYCERYGLPVDEDERQAPVLLHAKTGAHFVKTHYPELASDEIVSAIEKHTAADASLSLFEAMLYLADFMEEGRTYPDCLALRRMFYEGMASEEVTVVFYRTLLRALAYSIEELIKEGRPISVRTVRARNSLLSAKKLS